MRHRHAVTSILRDYPRIYFACHRRHTRDPRDGSLVSERQVQVLDHLDEVNAMSLSTLAEHMGVTPATMSVTIDRLAARGYVSRTPDRADRRRVHLRLTANGARVCEAHSVLDPALLDALVEAVPENERARALDGLHQLALAAERMPRSSTAHLNTA